MNSMFDSSFPPGWELGLVLGLAFTVTLFLYRCFFRIEEGHLGVVTTFGKALFTDQTTHQLKTFHSGLHFKWPWQKVISVSTMEQSIDLSGNEGGITAMARDGTLLRLDSQLRYAPVVEELYDFLFALREPVEHIKGLFTCLIRNEIANFRSALEEDEVLSTGSYSVIRRERRLLNNHLDTFAKEKMGGRYGVRFDAIDLTDILPPDELAQALNAVINAHTEANTAYARAEGECQSRILAAKKGVAIATERAKAAEIEILTLGKYLAELKQRGTLNEYVERRRAEATFESRAVFVRRPS